MKKTTVVEIRSRDGVAINRVTIFEKRSDALLYAIKTALEDTDDYDLEQEVHRCIKNYGVYEICDWSIHVTDAFEEAM